MALYGIFHYRKNCDVILAPLDPSMSARLEVMDHCTYLSRVGARDDESVFHPETLRYGADSLIHEIYFEQSMNEFDMLSSYVELGAIDAKYIFRIKENEIELRTFLSEIVFEGVTDANWKQAGLDFETFISPMRGSH